jgi:hypothetical protein
MRLQGGITKVVVLRWSTTHLSSPNPLKHHTSHLTLPHPLLRLRLPLVPPPRQRRPSINRIARAPQHALLIRLLGYVVVRADDVELPGLHLRLHVRGDLGSGPRARGLWGGGVGRVAGLGVRSSISNQGRKGAWGTWGNSRGR